ncbi:MAG: hypothetical protein IID44_02730 [Planctomycetes bacterium]|nr:hypothetical protein [Planctomycetota bacterium]
MNTPLFRQLVPACVLACSTLLAAAVTPLARAEAGDVLRPLLAGPLKGVEEIVFAQRVSGKDHWYVNFGYYCNEPARMGFGEGGRLCRLNLRSGKLKVLLDDAKGGVRDPQVHYDAKKILFSYRKGGTKTYHLYEINVDGTGLTQLTDGPDDDIEPTYLPDGGIMFGSSRCQRVVNCWISRVTTLYRCDGDGKNIRLISSNNDHDNTPWMLPDGRVLYMRWEYVDRSQVHFHHLWTVNPDGTSQMVYYGNERGGVAMLDAKPIPGTDKVVASFSPGHGMPEHLGYVTVVRPNAGPDVLASTKRISKQLFRDPYAISEECFLVADRSGISVMDGKGNTELVYKRSAADGPMESHEPRPLVARPRERVISNRTDLSKKTGELVLADIYEGRGMVGVKRGEIKKLLVLEQLPKPVNFSGGQDPLSIGGTFTLARILGTVPVEPDGSAYLKVPALRSLFMVALDKDDLSVKRMQSFVTVQPGERSSCVGCHEQRSKTSGLSRGLAALRRPPSVIAAIDDVPDVIDYPRDVQPILDRHCVRCHDADLREGGVELTGDHTPMFSVSYWTMVKRGLFADGRNKPYSQRPPRTIGSSASRLMKLIDGSHYGVKLSQREHKTIRLWIDTSATYPGTYAALGSGTSPVEFPLATMQRRCGSCHSVRPIVRPHIHYRDFHVHFGPKQGGIPSYLSSATWQHPLVPQSRCNLSRPDKSLIVRAPLAKEAGGLGLCQGQVFASTKDPDYLELLGTIETAAEQLKKQKRFDMPRYRPNEHYVREMQRFGALTKELGKDEPVDVYATDAAYWKSFWHTPRKPTTAGK